MDLEPDFSGKEKKLIVVDGPRDGNCAALMKVCLV